MPAVLRFVSSAKPAPIVALLGRQVELSLLLSNADASAGLLQLLPDAAERKVAAAATAGLHPTPHGGASTSLTFTSATADIAYRRLHILATPKEATRHNSPQRPDVATRLCRGPLKGENGMVEISVLVLLPPEAAADDRAERSAVLTMAAAVARAFSDYTRKGGRTEDGGKQEVSIAFEHASGAPVTKQATLDLALYASDGVRRAAALVDMPCNELHCSAYAERAHAVARALPNVEIEEIVGEELQARGFGGIYGVGKAAVNPPRLVILKYTPAGAKRTVAWCGKGIVYDTGGLSIKGKTAMPGMKRDMGGSAAVLCAFEAAVRAGFKDNLYALLAMAENAVGPEATRPDDIHTLYSGKTVEINNTDAEGRLVLGDAVSYAAQVLKPDVLLDMATLTGAQGIATGRLHGAVVCSDAALEAAAVRAGIASGDLVHPLMWCPELFTHEFASSVADMKNSVRDRSNGQVSCAAQFIGNHLPEGWTDQGKWIHVDMAAPAYSGERGTGYGVALLLELFHE